jgi:hypothetical protein
MRPRQGVNDGIVLVTVIKTSTFLNYFLCLRHNSNNTVKKTYPASLFCWNFSGILKTYPCLTSLQWWHKRMLYLMKIAKVKVKLSLCLTKHHAMKTYWGSGSIAPRILDLCTRWRWVVSFTHRSLYPQGKSPWYPLNKKLVGPQSRSGRGGEEKNSKPPPGIEA